MKTTTRREVLSDIGKGMLTASVGAGLATEIGIDRAFADNDPKPIDFGRLEPLVEIMQLNSADKMLPLVVSAVKKGTSYKDVVAAAALANARTFGGEDYIGFHAFMAMAPAYQMTKELPPDRSLLPILKVLYRSTNQIQAKGGRSAETLHDLETSPIGMSGNPAINLRNAARVGDMDKSEAIFDVLFQQSPKQAYDAVQALAHDDTDVHRVVLTYRAWDLLGLTGMEYAHTSLRQTVHYAVNTESRRLKAGYPESGIRKTLPVLIDRYHLTEMKFGHKSGDDKWINELCSNLLNSTPNDAADAMAKAIQSGYSHASVGEALSLASTRRVLTDPGRSIAYPGKPVGSVHGDSVGVHASDSSNAWRNIAKYCNETNAVLGMVVGAYHLSVATGNDWRSRQPYSVFEHAEIVASNDSSKMLTDLDGAIRENRQAQAAAIVKQYGIAGNAEKPLFELLLKFAISEDGALHAEKYYRTVAEEFGRTRKSLRWEHLAALARVTASEYGKRADGYGLACDILKINA